MNCCCLIILLLLLGNGNSACGNSCVQPRRRSSNVYRAVCDDNCSDSVSNCTRTQTVITRTECDSNSCAGNMASDNYGSNRYSMYNMNDDDCDCRNK